ncbi:MAG: response regulator transcription factor [Actinomycetota bacterium]
MASILIVEDDPLVRNSLRFIIEAGGHVVTEAEDGSVALKAPLADYDLVITDILMPEVSGIEVIRALRALPAPPPIIAMSGGNRLDGDDPLEVALASGALVAMRKPFSAKDLMAAVSRCLAPS